MKFTRQFRELNKEDAPIAGGKGASLGEMLNAGIPVPDGFVVTATTFEEFLHKADLAQEIDAILDAVDHKAVHTVDAASEKIQALIKHAEMPQAISKEIESQFKLLDSEFVAVRSSATAEDGADHAWAGQLESYLNITKSTLLEKVQHCWASLFTPRAIFYRFEKGLHTTKISVAVVVQKMVNSEKSGIAFSVHPVTEDRNQLIIEAGFGLGEAIVSGSVTPDSYVVEKEPRRIIDINVSNQTRALYRKEEGGNEWVELPNEKATSQVLNESEILEFSEIVLGIEKHYNFPCDIEWAYEGGKFYITQSRPITTLSNNTELNIQKTTLPRWEKILQRNFPPFALTTSGYFEFTGFKIGPMTWIREREILIRYKTVQMYMIQDPSCFYISNINDLLDKEYPEFESAVEAVNRDVFEGVRIAPGKSLADLEALNKLHIYMYGVMLIGFDVAIDIKAKIDAVINNNQSDFQSYLATPIEKTGVEREKEAIAEAKNSSEEAFEKLAQDFGYLHQDYLGKPWNSEDYKKACNDDIVLNSGMQESYDISNLSPYEQYLIRIFRKMIYMYEEGRNAMVRVCWAMKETVASLGYDPEAMLYMTETEVRYFAEGKGSYINSDLLEKRKEAFVMYFEAGKYYEFTGNEEVWKFIQDQKIEYIWEEKVDNDTTLKGSIAYKGKATGKVRLVFTQEDANAVEEGDILVSPMTQVEFLSGIRKCAAIVTDEGGIICHAAIVSREFGKPCILATGKATKILKNGDIVEVDADVGIVRILETEKKPFYYKAYTRDTGFIIQKAWIRAVGELYKNLNGQIYEYPPIIMYLREGTLEIYDNEEFDNKLKASLLAKNKQDSEFFNSYVNLYLAELPFFEELWKKGRVESVQELQSVLARLNPQIERYVVYYLSQYDEESPSSILEKGRKIRETDEFFARTDKMLRQSLQFLYPELSGVENAVRQEEIMNPPLREELQKRQNGSVFMGEEVKVQSLNDLPYSFDALPEKATSVKGQVGFKGKVQGKVFILKRNSDVEKVKEGDIIVSPMTTPEHVAAMKKAAAFVTDEGGVTCHAAIIAREMKKPCVIGTKHATEIFKEGDFIEVDADNGIVTVINA